MSDGDGDADWDKIKVEGGEANFSSRVILAMITTLKAAKEVGGLTQDDMVSLLQNWIKLSAHFQRGGGANRLKVGVVKDERTQALALAYSKGGLLAAPSLANFGGGTAKDCNSISHLGREIIGLHLGS
jgi:hypothetical protein